MSKRKSKGKMEIAIGNVSKLEAAEARQRYFDRIPEIRAVLGDCLARGEGVCSVKDFKDTLLDKDEGLRDAWDFVDISWEYREYSAEARAEIYDGFVERPICGERTIFYDRE